MGSTTQRSASAAQHRMAATSSTWASASKPDRSDNDLHLSVLLSAIEHEIIPRLMLAHQGPAECLSLRESTGPAITEADVELFVRLVLSPDEQLAQACIHTMRAQGVQVDAICLGLLTPVARRLGELWEQDLCDFTEVTLGLGRLQQVLRELSPAFDQPAGSPANGRRILLAPAPGEQHSFGLVMVAEFFRRAGWDVEPLLGPTVFEAELVARREWFDIVGFSLGAEIHLDALARSITALRAVSLNPQVGIIVGGPLFTRHPEHAQHVGADAVAGSGNDAPALADRLIADKGQAPPSGVRPIPA